MRLNIGGSSSKNFVKYNAKADKWLIRGPDGNELETQRPMFLLDLANIRTGWLRFADGQAPERVIDPALDRPAPNPGEGFKRGFVVTAFSQKFFGGTVEFSSGSNHLSNAIRELYATFDEQSDRPENRGKVPVIGCTGSDPMKDKFGTNFKPRLELVKWVDRRPELPDVSPVEETEVWRSALAAHPAPAATHVPPPAAQSPAAPAAYPTAPPVAIAAPAPASDPALETEF